MGVCVAIKSEGVEIFFEEVWILLKDRVTSCTHSS